MCVIPGISNNRSIYILRKNPFMNSPTWIEETIKTLPARIRRSYEYDVQCHRHLYQGDFLYAPYAVIGIRNLCPDIDLIHIS